MKMIPALEAFPSQFSWEPDVMNAAALPTPLPKRCIVLGMGGSHLAADIVRDVRAELPFTVHSDYGLPAMPTYDQAESLVIASSYSGNTEEVLDGLEVARSRGLPCAVIASGGALLARAEREQLPYIQLPANGMQPRVALGVSLKAFLRLIGDEEGLAQVAGLASTLQPTAFQDDGTALANELRGSVPVIYTSTRNRAVGYNWKIAFNETGKVPAFANVVPELNHNEMTSFDAHGRDSAIQARFHFLLMTDEADHPRVQKRMRILADLFTQRGFAVTERPLTGAHPYEKVFASLLLANWTAVETAALLGLDAEEVPMVEEFKNLMKQ